MIDKRSIASDLKAMKAMRKIQTIKEGLEKISQTLRNNSKTEKRRLIPK